CRDYGVRMKTLTRDAETALLAYGWPGNVRELANVMERVVLLSDADQVKTATLDLPRETVSPSGPVEPATNLDEQLSTFERTRIAEALESAGGNLSRAAAQLGLPRNTLRYRMQRHGLGDAATPKRRRTPEPGAPPSDNRDRSEVPADRVEWQRTRVTLLDVQGPDSDAVVAHEHHRAFEEAAEKAMAFGGRVIERGPSRLVAAFGLEPAADPDAP